MLYKAILYNSTNKVEVEEISDKVGKEYMNGGVYSSYFDGKTSTFAVGETETIALEKLLKGIEGMAQTYFNAYQEYIKQLDSIKEVINNKRKIEL